MAMQLHLLTVAGQLRLASVMGIKVISGSKEVNGRLIDDTIVEIMEQVKADREELKTAKETITMLKKQVASLQTDLEQYDTQLCDKCDQIAVYHDFNESLCLQHAHRCRNKDCKQRMVGHYADQGFININYFCQPCQKLDHIIKAAEQEDLNQIRKTAHLTTRHGTLGTAK